MRFASPFSVLSGRLQVLNSACQAAVDADDDVHLARMHGFLCPGLPVPGALLAITRC